MVYFPYFERQWASHRSLLRSASHTDLVLVCKDGHQVHLHRAMLVTRSPLLADLLSSQESSIISLPQVEENTVWRLVDLLYSGSCTLYSPASADDLEELIQQLDLGGKVAELSVLEEVEPQEYVEELMITKAMEKVLKRALRRKASVKRKFICSTSPAVAKKAKELEASCEVDKEIPATLRDTRICPLCGFACTSAFHLKAHLATNHFLSQLSAIVAPGDFSTEETKVLHCEKCGINFSGSRTLYRAAVHRATEHGALAPLLRQRLEELKQQRFCRICGTFAPLKASSEDMSLIQGSEVATAFSREQSKVALALHLATEHYMGRLLTAVKPGQLSCHFCDLVCRLPQVLAVHLGVYHNMALDIHDWDEGGKSGQREKEVPDEKEVHGRHEHMDRWEGVEEVGGVVSGPCDNAKEDEEILKDSVEVISETWQTLNGRNTDEEVVSTGKNLEENKVNHADIGIEDAPKYGSEVLGNSNSKVDSRSAEEWCSQHNSDGPQCPKCDQFCKDHANLKNHLLSHYYHDFYRVTPETKPFLCPTCRKKHRDRITLIRHFAFTHGMIYELTDVTPEMLNATGKVENHKENEANHAEIGIEEVSEALAEHGSEVMENLNSAVKSSSADEYCSEDEEKSANTKATGGDIADEMGGDKEKGNAALETVKTQAEGLCHDLKISPRQFYEKGGSVVWAECPGEFWFPAILPKSSALKTNTPSISYILPFPAKAASNLVQLFDSEGSWKRVEVVEPLGEDREVDEMRLRAEGNQVERRLAYGKALQYQSLQTEQQKVTELDLNISHSGGENEKKEALEKQKNDFKMPKPIDQKSEAGKSSKSAMRGNRRKSKRKRNSSIVTRSQSVQRQTSQARGEESREPELPIYPFLPRDLTLTRLRRGDQ